jgi:hypothetical protein
MNSKDTFDSVVKPKLTEVFGNFMGNSISSQAYLTAFREIAKGNGSGIDTYVLVIEIICSSEQTIAMWGENGAAKQKEEWLSMIG